MRIFILSIFLLFGLRSMALVHADFTADKFSGCPPLLVNFTNSSLPGGLTLRWDFDNGNFSSLSNPSAILQNPGVYNVKLIVSNGTETDSIIKTVTVFHLPVVDFHADHINICQGDTLKLFSDITLGDAPIINYAWDLGNGIARSGDSVFYKYNLPRAYDITLVVQDSNFCSANLTKNMYVQVLQKPVAAFTATPANSCNYSQLISFTSTSSGTGLTYFWKLDTAVTSTAQNPSHTYVQEQQNVWLVVTSSNGCVDSIKHRVSVTSLSSDFVADKTDACTGEPITFSNLSNFVGNCRWNFGDGTTSTSASPIQIYTAPGTYTVTMINTVSGVCKDTITKVLYIHIRQGIVPTFTVSIPPVGCGDTAVVSFDNTTVGGSGVTYQWTFGDGDSSSVIDPTHVYHHNGNFNVTLTATDPSGCAIPVSIPVAISSHMPVAKFRADTLGCVGGAVRFHNQSSGSTTYLWSFSDGTTSTDPNPLHYFPAEGFYSATLTASNASGCDSTVSRINYIHILNPQIDFSVGQTYSPCPPLVTSFNSTADRPGMKFHWDFGDGNTDTAARPTHVYFMPGVYTVTLIGTTASGCTDTITYVDLIHVEGPTGTFTESSNGGCLPFSIDFTVTTSANTLSLWADLGDGTLIQDSTQFTHLYTAVDSFHPQFILIDHVGCAVTYVLPTLVTRPSPVLNLPDTNICEGSSLAMALGVDNYEWTPPTYLSCHVCSSVSINPSDNIDYRVSATNSFGCTVVDSMHIHVEKLADFIANPAPINICKHTPVTLNAGSAEMMTWTPSTFLDDSNAIHPIATADSSMTYYVTGHSSAGCRKSAQIQINVIDKLDIDITPDFAICIGDSAQLSAAVLWAPDSIPVTYRWTPAIYLNDAFSSNPSAHYIPFTTHFIVYAAAANCGSDTAAVTVTVNSPPDIHAASDDSLTTPGAEVGIHASSTFNLSYVWKAIDAIKCPTCQETQITPRHTQTIMVTGTTDAGCTASDSLSIEVINCDPETIFIPNTFTPNGDGINDKFYVHSRALSTLNFMRVFDEWGKVVFETKNINEGWDGNSAGLSVASSVYTYVVEGKCENGYDIKKSGNIALVR